MSTLRLVLVPGIITAAVTLLRLVGELNHWSRTFFNPDPGGGLAIVGIAWLVPIFGVYFAMKQSSGQVGSGWRTVGFAALAASPILALVIAFQAIQRTANFAISNPAREVLFTVVERAEKYKAKNVIDIVVFRGADAVSGWLFAALRGLGLELSAISLATVPVAAGWFVLALALGRAQERRARQR